MCRPKKNGTRQPQDSSCPVLSALESRVPSIISLIDGISAVLRPTRSAYRPRTTAPSGRTRYEMPKVPNAISSETVSSVDGKNSLAMVSAKNP